MLRALAICTNTEIDMFLAFLSIVCMYFSCKSQRSASCSIVSFLARRRVLISDEIAFSRALSGL